MRLLSGNRRMAAQQEWNVTSDSSTDPMVGSCLRTALRELFPALKESGFSIDYEWTGIMGTICLEITVHARASGNLLKDSLLIRCHSWGRCRHPSPNSTRTCGSREENVSDSDTFGLCTRTPHQLTTPDILGGFSGHGMPRVFGAAKDVVEMILGRLDPVSYIPCFLPSRFAANKSKL